MIDIFKLKIRINIIMNRFYFNDVVYRYINLYIFCIQSIYFMIMIIIASDTN